MTELNGLRKMWSISSILTKISCETELAELKKGVLGNVLVKGKVVNNFEVTITLDPKNVANSIVSVVNKGVDLLKDKVLNPLESAFKQNKAVLSKKQQKRPHSSRLQLLLQKKKLHRHSS